MSNYFARVFDFKDGGQLLIKKSRSGTDLSEPFEITAIIQIEHHRVQFEPELVRSFKTEADRDMEFYEIGQEEAADLYNTLEQMGNDFLKQKGFEMN